MANVAQKSRVSIASTDGLIGKHDWVLSTIFVPFSESSEAKSKPTDRFSATVDEALEKFLSKSVPESWTVTLYRVVADADGADIRLVSPGSPEWGVRIAAYQADQYDSSAGQCLASEQREAEFRRSQEVAS